MFTGLIEEVGTVLSLEKNTVSASIQIGAKQILKEIQTGDSIAVNGVCLTVSAYTRDTFTADVMHETMDCTTMRLLKSGSRVNLERALLASGRFGGHIVTGHVDGTGVIRDIKRDENAVWYEIAAENDVMRYIIRKGSVAVDGISLTAARVEKDSFFVSVIPHTAENTALSGKKCGDGVNLENDCVGKYIAHFLVKQREEPAGEGKRTEGVTRAMLLEHGFL